MMEWEYEETMEDKNLEERKRHKKQKHDSCGGDHEKPKHYDCDVQLWVKTVYLIAVLFWFFLVYILDLFDANDFIVWIILAIPILVFIINVLYVEKFDCQVEEEMFKSNFLSFGFLITIILINWNSPLGKHDKTKFLQILVVAFILLMVSLIDVWVDKHDMSIVYHVKTALHTISLTLLALALYLYYKFYENVTYSPDSFKLF